MWPELLKTPAKLLNSEYELKVTQWKNEQFVNTNAYAQCLGLCPPGWTTNGDPDKVCVQCDESCLSCQDNGPGIGVGDVKKCTRCAATHPMLYAAKSQCFVACGQGYYQVYKDPETGQGNCDQCQPPCAECKGDK